MTGAGLGIHMEKPLLSLPFFFPSRLAFTVYLKGVYERLVAYHGGRMRPPCLHLAVLFAHDAPSPTKGLEWLPLNAMAFGVVLNA